MRKLLTWFGFILLFIGLVAPSQPALAESGIIGTPPAPPDPGAPVLQFSGCGGKVVSPHNESYEQQVINLFNQERTSRGLPPLQYSEGLTRAARYHAVDMGQDNYFSHDSKDWIDGKLQVVCNTWSRISSYYSGAQGETIAYGYSSPSAVTQGWMNSQGHKDIILNPSSRAVGVGFYDYYWVADFGTQIDTVAEPTLSDLPNSMTFYYSIPDQKLVPSYMNIKLTNVGSPEVISWRLDRQGAFFSATPDTGTTPTSVRVTPDNFNQNKKATLSGSITIEATHPSSVEGAPHTTQVTLKVVNTQFHQVFLPGVHK